jgi:acyl-coenzyme A synthetase/AMP-(fatty) acid ligase
MIQLRGPHTLRGVCGRNREELFTADGLYPTGDLGHLHDEGFMFYHGRSDDMFKVSGATVYPSEVERALRTIEGVDGAFVTNVRSDRGDRVGADRVAAVGLRRRRPEGITGKVDVRRLPELLTETQTLGVGR